MSIRDLVVLGSSSQQHTRARNQGAYLLRWNSEGLLFDPGEGTQRQFIFANVTPTSVTRILISHFHGDHCLGLGSMLLRLNLDKVKHPIHCYFPASGQKYFTRLRYCSVYHENIHVIEHPIHENGIVHEDENFKIEAFALDHGIDNFGYRVSEPDCTRYYKDEIERLGVKGALMKELITKGVIEIDGKSIRKEDVSYHRRGDVFAYVMDTRLFDGAYLIAKDATMLLCESTYLDEAKETAYKHKHLTAKQAAMLAKESGVGMLLLSHFSARYLDQRVFSKEAREFFLNTEVAKDLKKFDFPKHELFCQTS